MPTDTKTLEYDCPRCGLGNEVQVSVRYSTGAPEVGILPGWEVSSIVTFCGCWLVSRYREKLGAQAVLEAERMWLPSGAPRAGARR